MLSCWEVPCCPSSRFCWIVRDVCVSGEARRSVGETTRRLMDLGVSTSQRAESAEKPLSRRSRAHAYQLAGDEQIKFFFRKDPKIQGLLLSHIDDVSGRSSTGLY